MIVVSIDNQSRSEELFEKISHIENVTKMTNEQMEQCMKKNIDHIRKVKDKFNKQTSIFCCFSIISVRLVIKNKRLIIIQSGKLLRKWWLRKISD
jgi:hypothetical protein